MDTTQKRRLPDQGNGAQKNGNVTDSVACKSGMVNLSSPRLWWAFRKFNRNFKRIARLQEENARLLDVMRRAQGGPGVRHGA